MSDTRPVIAGVEGSPSSIAAAQYAAAFASRRRAPLHLIHAHRPATYSYTVDGMFLPDPVSDETVRKEIDRELRQLADRLRQDHPELGAIAVRQIEADPAALLIEQSRGAQATIVGCRGIGGFTELMLGSVAAQLAAHARGPVIVLRPPVDDRTVPLGPEQRPLPLPLGPVLAGYDGSREADTALAFAAAEAAQRHTTLIVAHVHAEGDEYAARLLRAAVEPWAATYPGLAIEMRPIHSDHAGRALVEASRHVALTVVGSRGRGGFTALLLGSVSQTLIHHAYGPVAVTHL